MRNEKTENEEVTLGPLSQIPPGEGREFCVRGERVAVFHLRDGNVYAVQALCPHKQGPLSDGLTGGSVVVCPYHARKYDLKTGAALSGECGLTTYPIRVTDSGHILVSVETVPASISPLS